MAKFESVDDYLASLDAPKGDTLRAIIDVALEESAGLECKLAWNVPQIHLEGRYVLGRSALTNHLDLSPWSEDVMDEFRDRLRTEGYECTRHLVKVPVDWEVDRRLVVDMVRARLRELGT